MKLGLYNETIESLTEREEDFMEESVNGIYMLRLFANFSDQIEDITNMNFETSSRILIWI